MTTTQTKSTKSTKPICGIYEIRCGKYGSYIGQSIDIIERAKEHLNGSNREGGLVKGKHSNRFLQSAFNIAPKSFKLYLVQECERKHLDALEAYWIQKLGELNIKQEKRKPLWCIPVRNENKFLLKFSDLPGFKIPIPPKKKSGLGIAQLITAGAIGCLFFVGAHKADLPVVPVTIAGIACGYFAKSR